MTKPFILGLTGSIGMGKTTASQFFADLGCGIWNADAAVHRMYSPGGAAVDAIGGMKPSVLVDGAVSRERLKDWIVADPKAMARLEAIVHPLVAQDRAHYIETTQADIIVLDMPLLFETGAETQMDAVATVSTSAENQRKRVLARGTMDEAMFETILGKQLPDAEKRARADYIIPTDTIEGARAAVDDIVAQIRKSRDA